MSSVEPADIPVRETAAETAGSLGLCGPLDAGPPGGGWPGALPDTADGPDPATHPGPARVLPAVVAAATRWFDAAYLPAHAPSAAYTVAATFTTAMHRLLELPLAGPQLTLGLQTLLQARDCCMRAVITAHDE